MSAEVTVTAGNFDAEVIKSPIPVLLDFWAPWCGPCRMIAPVIEELAGEYEGRLKVGKINIDEEAGLSDRHGVVSIPTLVLYRSGAEAGRRVGAAPKREIEGMFKDLV